MVGSKRFVRYLRVHPFAIIISSNDLYSSKIDAFVAALLRKRFVVPPTRTWLFGVQRDPNISLAHCILGICG